MIEPMTGRTYGILFPWTVLNNKIERVEPNRPMCLTSAWFLCHHKGMQIGVVREHCDGVPAAFEVELLLLNASMIASIASRSSIS
jgi:hypothetical protein